MKNKYLRFLTSFLLCGIILVNCNTFRRDTYAFGAVAIPVIVEGGEFVIYVTAAAVSAIAGIIAGTGINAASRSDEENLIKEYSNWYIETYGYEAYLEMLGETGFTVEPATEPTGDSYSLPDYDVDVPGNKAGTFVVNSDGTYTNLDWYKNNELGSGSEPPNKTPLGKRIVAGFLAAAEGVATIGNSLYEFLHNSENVVYTPAQTFGTISGDLISETYRSFVFDLVKQYFPAEYHDEKYKDKIDGLDRSFLNYKYYKFFYYCDGSTGFHNYHNNVDVYLNVAVLGWDDNGNYMIGQGNYAYMKGYSDSFGKCYLQYRTGSDYSSAVYDIHFGDGSNSAWPCLNDHVEGAYYAVSDGLSDSELDQLENENKATVTVGDNVYNITQGDNIYNTANYLTEQAQSAANAKGQVLVTAPAYDTENNVVIEDATEPTAITSALLNPDLDLSTDLSESTLESGNIFTLCRDFFLNFFAKLAQTLKNLFFDIFVPSEGFFENKINEIREKHCSSAGTIHFDELEIPDITWNPSGSRWGDDIEPIVIVDNSYLRNNIDSYRAFIAGVIYITWLFHEMYRLLGILNVVKVDK